jgi:hypothetical protein
MVQGQRPPSKAVCDAAERLWNQIPLSARSNPARALAEAEIAMAWFRVPYGRGSKVPGAAYDLLARRIAAMDAAARPAASSSEAE